MSINGLFPRSNNNNQNYFQQYDEQQRQRRQSLSSYELNAKMCIYKQIDGVMQAHRHEQLKYAKTQWKIKDLKTTVDSLQSKMEKLLNSIDIKFGRKQIIDLKKMIIDAKYNRKIMLCYYTNADILHAIYNSKIPIVLYIDITP